MAEQPTGLVVDVRTTETMGALVLAPRDTADFGRLRGAVTRALPGVDARRTALGLTVDPAAAAPLLTANLVHTGLDLRWSHEAEIACRNRVSARAAHAQLRKQVDSIRVGGRPVAEQFLRETRGLHVLDDHQFVNVAAMTLQDGFGLCLFDEQGTGKTVTVIFAFDVLVSRDLVDALVVVAPKSMVPEWPRDFAQFMADFYRVRMIEGDRPAKRAALWSGADVLVTNFETVVSMEADIRSFLRWPGRRVALVIDESFHVKNLDARRTLALRRLREWCRWAFVLCGTPAPNSPHDLIEQFNIVDFGITFAGVSVPKDPDTARLVVQQAVDERGLFVRHIKQEVLPHLPRKRFNRVLLEMEPLQGELYARALHDLVLDLTAVDETLFRKRLASFLAQRTALLQICSNPIGLAPAYDRIPAKVEALDRLLEEVVARGEKVVIWSFFRASLDAIARRYRRFNPVRYDGTISAVADRRESVRRFQEDDTTMLFVGNPAAAGAGLTLHRARVAVYESLSNQGAHYLQSIDRIHRRGQTREVECVVLLCDRTIEVTEYDRLLQKEQASQMLLRDHVDPPWTRQGMLDEALDALAALSRPQQ